MYSPDFSTKQRRSSILSSPFVWSVSRCPNTTLPLWRPRSHHRSYGTVPSEPSVSLIQQRGVPYQPNIGLRLWWSLSVLNVPPTSPTALWASSFPAWSTVWRTGFQGLRTLPFLHLVLLQRPAALQVLFLCVWSPGASVSQLHAGPLPPFDLSYASVLRYQNRVASPVREP